MEKRPISAQQLQEDSWALAVNILKGDFRPTFIIGIWRGGCPVGMSVHEMLDYFGVKADHIAIRTRSYTGIDQRMGQVEISGLSYVIEHCTAADRLLICDDVWDTGLSIEAVLKEIRSRCRDNTPCDIRVAVPYFKSGKNKTESVPDYFIHETDEWLMFPHEMNGYTKREILENKPGLKELLERMGSTNLFEE
ncbi:hypothetical protein KIPB_001960 [Kipferlia bialata]|uniref:Phosphoribosyltransferase domain-containing protein n=1 Tax=Kipferlia bialata TaxID=797122 RepID=A0A9K3CQQ7_9EUKA|nr:hypothetical protein KIPB_001960 [Kipferlia bialata]|eukprot:g1960.t1